MKKLFIGFSFLLLSSTAFAQTDLEMRVNYIEMRFEQRISQLESKVAFLEKRLANVNLGSDLYCFCRIKQLPYTNSSYDLIRSTAGTETVIGNEAFESNCAQLINTHPACRK